METERLFEGLLLGSQIQSEEILKALDKKLKGILSVENTNRNLFVKFEEIKECIVSLARMCYKSYALVSENQNISSERFPPIYSKPLDYVDNIFSAAQKGNIRSVQYNIERRGFDPDALDSKSGNTLLHIAVSNGDLLLVQYLIEKGCADPTVKNRGGRTPLNVAFEEKKGLIFRYLCTANKSVMGTPANFVHQIHLAAQTGNLESVKFLVEKADVDAKEKNQLGTTPLHLAAQYGQLPVVQYLIEDCGIDPEIRDKNGNTPLQVACIHDQLEVVKYLIETIGLSKFDEKAPITYAWENNSRKVVLYFLNQITPIEDTLPDLINLNQQKITILHWAARKGYLPIVKYLVEKAKVDPLKTNKNGENSLFYSSVPHNEEVMNYLANVLKVSLPPEDFQSNLFEAVKNGHLPSVKYIIENSKVSIDETNDKGETLLTTAINSGHLPIVQYLIENADASIKTINHETGETPFILAVTIGDLPMIQYFVERLKVDINEANELTGDTAFYTALKSKRQNVIEYLCKVRHVKLPPADFETDIFKALEKNDLNSVRYLIEVVRIPPTIKNEDEVGLLKLASKCSLRELRLYILKITTPKFVNNPPYPNAFEPDLFTAAEHGNISSLQYLVEVKKVDLNKVHAKNHNIYINMAVINGHLLVLQYLIDRCHVNVNICNRSGDTPLHFACKMNHILIIDYLVSKEEIDINIADKNGDTPLHWATKYGSVEAVKILVQNYVIKQPVNNEDKTPLDVVCQEYQGDNAEGAKEEITKLLSQNYA
ncbi:serine/threonine-protein phosphatase 6 regulatory ankyrin repeat subunit B-like isoform X1 [Histomonas meleagridis]|uniref:serine/threonine-protein phosphatase 6 regulatory ankyrin repeat subunit B-like isoform X1 n=1 Tax=Histomonas meleagridis TaxID=135588 RepID=UPI00355973A6|nr:serine/threonine-protein phosphatase 6 regulatory ankyrin repeat subunit B-like isoform X1 [Histomonas meleagridis]KAH0805534.1 serine/threonine-protein phosphatase 6 regulatory ankyrin repeat subunit B-like isoform X1 [Histomonas meleagridis]